MFAAKKLLFQRVLQIVQLLSSPIVGAILAIAAAKATEVPICLIGVIEAFLLSYYNLSKLAGFIAGVAYHCGLSLSKIFYVFP